MILLDDVIQISLIRKEKEKPVIIYLCSDLDRQGVYKEIQERLTKEQFDRVEFSHENDQAHIISPDEALDLIEKYFKK